MHSDLPATTLRGYVQVETPANAGVSHHVSVAGVPGVLFVDPPSYLGPTIVAQRDTPVRVKFTNKLPTGAGGDLFLPVDTTVMGAQGPDRMAVPSSTRRTAPPCTCTAARPRGSATARRTSGSRPPARRHAVSQGRQRQQRPRHARLRAPASLTFFYTNQQSARLMFYHDHAYGITRLNVYAGEAAGYSC